MVTQEPGRKDTCVMNQYVRQKNWRYRLYLIAKRYFDVAFSIVILIIFSPLFLIVSVLIKLDDGGPIIHKRICANGPYIMYKFRTMKTDADNLERYFTQEEIQQYQKETKLKNDPRITKIGAFLRKTSIDELPQFYSVLLGSMSIVGPRPIVDAAKWHYGDRLSELLSVKPGITGYWQCNGRGDSTYESGIRQELELYYVEHQSLWLDLKILFMTPAAIVHAGGGVLKQSVLYGRTYFALKRFLDITVSLGILVGLSPIFLIIATLIKLDDGGPVVHRRVCVGKDGHYIMYKFRTMKTDADNLEKYFDSQQMESFLRGEKSKDDPRITRIGHILRKTSIDELPQCLSVLQNHMSIVGPRPVTDREAAAYGAERDTLLRCKPGITGWLQVNGRGLAFLSDEAKEMQLYYVRNQSLQMDLRILLKTIKVVLGGEREGAK